MDKRRWLLLLYSLPANKPAARLALWRQLKRIGSVPLKTSACVLPDAPEYEESFQWLAERVKADGGDATLIKVSEISGLPDEAVIDLFQKARQADYHALHAELAALKPSKKSTAVLPDNFTARLQAVRRIDFFSCPGAVKVLALLERFHRPSAGKAGAVLRAAAYQGRTWQTRPRPVVDRIGSAWLIARFIDRKPRFVFAAEASDFPEALRYDMPDAHFGHEGGDCTFENLVQRFALGHEPGLAAMAALIHDADLDDGKFGRTEGEGLLAVFRGWVRLGWSDAKMLEQGFLCFDGLHRSLLAAEHPRKPLTKNADAKRTRKR